MQISRSCKLLVKLYYITNREGSQSRIRSLKTSQLNATTIEQVQKRIPDPYESAQSKLKIHGQKCGKTRAANGIINPSAQSSRVKQITSGSDYNFRSSTDIDMEYMMERDLAQTQPTTNDGTIVSTASRQLGTALWHARGETASIFAAQRVITESMNFENEMNIPHHGHLEAQSTDRHGFQPLTGQVKEQPKDDPQQDHDQLDLNNLPDNPENQGLPGKKKKGGQQRQFRFLTALADVGLEALIGGATTRDSSLEKLNPGIATTTGWKTHGIHHSLGNNQLQRIHTERILPNLYRQQQSSETLTKQSHNVLSKEINQKCKFIKRQYKRNFKKEQQKRFRKNKLNGGTQPSWFLNLLENGERYQMQVF
ncbi:MAG: hypothetical protein EZS28_011384 [Streblomastix strix]|uniref:Uncharacterized protein n=1 Tax=Streblomastix strix TaxID=222440 RepID=A0A5J4WDS7_9EUKA|nr:MAG: hypothetical protein EZS28_011384 [Streblomastix strix]